ncbi:MAG: DNA internalization-related competence protein ComEC/Rec2 [Rubrivivax sp.]|nr:DNA internalization-related competence protein ComEC/Rec2 [Rubrivivax sp.]
MRGHARGHVAPAARGALPALGWLAGVALQLQQPVLWAAMAAAALCGAAGLTMLLAWRWRRRWAGTLALTLGAAALGFGGTTLRAQDRLVQALAPALEGQDLVVTGRVAGLPQASLMGTRFVFETESALRQGTPVTLPPRLSLAWYRGADDDAWISGPAEALRAGQRWRLTLRLRAPHGHFNPGGFDLELWMFEQGMGASGYVRAGPDAPAVKLAENAGHPVERLRQRLREAIATHVPDAAAAGVLAALAVGDQAAIEREGWEVFRNTGVAHLMSISGLHITMFAWLAGGLAGRLWRLHPRLPLALPAPLAARWGGLAAAAGYALLAGWGVPAQRTVWMIAVVALLRSAGVRWPLHAVLLAAAGVVTLADPWAMLQPGFWLSFVAVALLVAAEPVHASGPPASGGCARGWAALRGALRTQAVATVGLAPLTLVFFQQVSLVGFLANALAIPVVTLLITPLALLGVLLPPLWSLAAVIVQGLTAYLQVLASWPLAVWQAAAAPPWAVACGLWGGALAVLPLPWRLRVLAVPLMLPLLAPPVARPPEGRFELVAADVGQGTAVLVRTRGHLLVFDAGPQYSPESDAGGRVLLPLLRARGETRIAGLMLSHRDSDHVGGAAALLDALPVGGLWSSLAPDHPLLARSVPQRRCDAGQRWEWDGVRFEVLHPLPGDHAMALKSNALSCVLRVQGQGHSVLITADIEAAQEAALVQREGSALRSDVLLVPHHGSRTSSSAEFIAAVQPRVAVVQAGYRSRFGHPMPDVVERYRARGIEVVRSDRCGAWTLPATGQAYCEREVNRRYWHHRMPVEAGSAP